MTNTVCLKHHLPALKLPTILAECAQVARQCRSAGMDHRGFVLRVGERELSERQRKAAERRLKGARWPAIKTIAGFDFAAQPKIDQSLVMNLMNCESLDRKENILLIGTAGTGKTPLARGLAVAACARGQRVRFVRVTELSTQLLEARQQRELTRFKNQFSQLDLLILEELG